MLEGPALKPKDTINVSFSGSDGSGVETGSLIYEVLGNVIYQGSSFVGEISKINAIVHIFNATSGDIRIFDVTNANTIAELTGFTDTIPTINDLGSISNLPSGEALFELQLLRTGGPGSSRCRCSNVQLQI